MPAKISVVIVNYNSGARLASCLEHLARQTFTDFDVIVIDNASSDGSEAIVDKTSLLANGASVKIIRLEKNVGFAGANNIAARETKSSWIALLNPDAYPEPAWLSSLVDGTTRFPRVKAFGSLQLNAADPETLDGAGDVATPFGIIYRGGYGANRDTAPAVDMACFAPCAAAALYERDTFLSLGGFDERFFCYGEDMDFGFRLRNAGGQSIQISEAVVRHEGSGVSGRRSEFTTYHGTRNRIWLFYKNLPGAIYWGLAPLRILADFVFWVKAAFHGVSNAYLRGLKDGYSQLGQFRDDRRAIAKVRKAARVDIAGALTWSPFKLWRRAIDLREIRDARDV